MKIDIKRNLIDKNAKKMENRAITTDAYIDEKTASELSERVTEEIMNQLTPTYEKTIIKNNECINMENQIEKDLKSLAEWLRDNGIDFKVVGSLALNICGFPLERPPHDIDIETITECEMPFKVLSDSQGNNYYKQKDEYSCTGHKPYIFKWGETMVNVWCVNTYSSDKCVWKDYVKYDVVSEVIRRKMKYGRAKDYRDLIASVYLLIQSIIPTSQMK